MKKFTLYFKTLALFSLLLITKAGNAQSPCASSFVYTINPAGVVSFSSTSTTTSSGTFYYWQVYSTGAGGYLNSFSGTNSPYTFSVNGTYWITLQIINNAPSCVATSSQAIVITNTGTPCYLNPNFSVTHGSNGFATFNNTSTGTVTGTTYLWNFGDNSPTSTAVSPVHTYSADGVYQATLTANNNFTSNCSSTVVWNIKVCSYAPITPSFSYTPNSGGNVTFTSTSTGTTSAMVYNWNFYGATAPWFPNGVNLTQTSANYSLNGTYNAYLQITNPVTTCSVMSVQTIVITNTVNPPCNINANFSINQGSGGMVTLNNTSTGTTPGVTYLWNFGDNSPTSTVVSPVHTYSADGLYSATLTANNNFPNTSCSSTIIKTVKICSYAPMTASYSYTPNSGGNVTYTSTSTGTTPATIYNWSFYSAMSPSVANGANITQTSANYSVNGSYTTTLKITDPVTTCSTSVGQIIVITNTVTPCNLYPYFYMTQGANGLVTFNNQSFGTAPSSTYFWNFGDNSTSTAASPVHTYSANGVYTTTFTVNNNFLNTCTSTTVQTVKICSYAPMTSSYSYTPNSGGNVTFTSTSTGTTPGTVYNWIFYSALTPSVANGVNLTQTSANYSVNGSYATILQIINPVTTCSASAGQTIVISNSNPPCNVNANFSISQGANGLVTLNNLSSGTVGGTTYFWNFGDNSTSNLVSPAHTYSADGVYTATLTANNNYTTNCASTIIKTVKICSYAPLNASYLYTVNGPVVTFTSTSTGTNANTMYNWYGYNGIGSFGSGANVTQALVTYTANGVYPVLLQISNPVTTCSASAMQSITVNFCTANASFDLTPTGTPQFWNATPVSPGSVTSAAWSWGDGSTSNTLYTSHTYSAAGNYWICLSVTVSCGGTNTFCGPYAIFRSSGAHQDQDVIQVNVIDPSVDTGIKNDAGETLEYGIYPNPNNGTFNVRGLKDGPVSIGVYNLVGKIIYQAESTALNGSLTKDLQFNTVANGVYFIKISSDKHVTTKKIIIENNR